ALTFQNHTNRPLTDFGGKTSIFSHPVYLFLREFSLQDSRGGSGLPALKDAWRCNFYHFFCIRKNTSARIIILLPEAIRHTQAFHAL
ncbi:hypothetical protein, partial [Escherichia coli]|uniref:hypothetical protein n=1 Tax=Escherichia coli TaxID=562 RepID=UPI001BDB9452